MLTLSKPISAGQAQAYHKSEFANAKENYYTEGERVRGEWQGRLATRYGLRGEVNEEQFARLSEGQHPATGEALKPGDRRDVPSGFPAPQNTVRPQPALPCVPSGYPLGKPGETWGQTGGVNP